MPTPPPGASSTIYVTPNTQTALPDLRTYPKPDLSRSLTQTRTSVQTNVNAPWNGGRERYQQQVNEQLQRKQNLQEQANQKIREARRGGNLQTPKSNANTNGGAINGSGRGAPQTSNGTSSTPSNSGGTPKGGGAPPAGAGAAGGAGLGGAAGLFWKGVGAGIGWEASKRVQQFRRGGNPSEIVSKRQEDEAIKQAERQKQQQYFKEPPHTEIIEKEKYEFSGGQMPVTYRVNWYYKQVLYDAGCVAYETYYYTNVVGPIKGTYVDKGVQRVTNDPRCGAGTVYWDFSELGIKRGNDEKVVVLSGQGYGSKSEWKIISVTRVDGQSDTGGNPPPTQAGSSSQYNGAAPGAILGGSEAAPPPPTPKPQPEPQPRPEGKSTKKPEPPPPMLYAPGVRGNIGTGTGTGTGGAPAAPAPSTLGGQSIITGSSGVGGTPSGLPEGVGSASGLPEGMFESSTTFEPQTDTDTRTGRQAQRQTQNETKLLDIPLPPPLLAPPSNPTSIRQDVKFPSGDPKIEQQEEKKVTQTAPPGNCELSNACVLNPVRDIQNQQKDIQGKQNTLLDSVNAIGQGIDLSMLNIINNKLGDQLPGGISGYFKKAWEATKMDKVINYLTLIMVIHNAAMLSRNLAETLGDAASGVLQFLGIKDHEQNAIDVNEVIGKSITDLIKSILGEEVYAGLSKKWNLANRIISAGMGVVAAIQNMVNAALDGLNTIGSWLAKMGNRAQEQGVVDDNSWSWMDERPNFRNPTARFLEKVDNLEDAADSVYMLVSSGIEVQEAYTEAVRATTDLTKALDDFNTDKNANEIRQKQNNTNPTPTKVDVTKHEPEEQ